MISLVCTARLGNIQPVTAGVVEMMSDELWPVDS